MKPNKLFLVVSLIALVYASLGRTQERATEKLGKVHFPVSCSAAAQEQFDRAVALLHSFWLDEAGKAFAAIGQADSSCAMAHWGTAMTLFGNPFTWPLSGKALPDGWAAVQKAQAAQAKTQRERDYIGAVEAFYKDSDKVDHRTRALAYVKAMKEVAQRYPEDTEASVFYALALDVTALPTDKTYANQLKAARILEKVFAEKPDHPGVAHYLIHSYDFPPIAAQGLTAARRYASIAPSAPHALHMPSHIFTRRGLWEESIETNRRSAATSKNHFDSLHAMDYLEYAYLGNISLPPTRSRRFQHATRLSADVGRMRPRFYRIRTRRTSHGAAFRKAWPYRFMPARWAPRVAATLPRYARRSKDCAGCARR